MGNKIQIKRSEVTATPPSLSAGELAYSEVSNTLFIGLGDNSVVSIGGVSFTSKLNGIEANANNYSLPTASSSTLGGVKVGQNLTINNGVLSGTPDTIYTHPTTSGNKHIPSGGVTGQILKWSADGTTVWGTLSKSDVGLSSVDNTADSAKNVLSASKLTTAKTIAGVSFNGTANISIPLANLTTDSTHRVITDTQLSQLSTLYNWYSSMTASDADSLVDTIAEVLNAFSGANEGLNLASELTSPTAMTLDGGIF